MDTTQPTASIQNTTDTQDQTPVQEPQQAPVEQTPTPSAPQQAEPDPAPVEPTLTQHEQWMKDAGLKQEDWASADELIALVSNWDVNSRGLGDSYGLGKLPDRIWKNFGCNKTENPVDHIDCMNKYISVRYSDWASALQRYKTSNFY